MSAQKQSQKVNVYSHLIKLGKQKPPVWFMQVVAILIAAAD